MQLPGPTLIVNQGTVVTVNLHNNLPVAAGNASIGGGLRLQAVNGAEVGRFATSPKNWYSVNVTNNIIANNVAGWDGGGVSLQDALNVNFINNTVASNDTTASSGVLFNTLGAPEASIPPGIETYPALAERVKLLPVSPCTAACIQEGAKNSAAIITATANHRAPLVDGSEAVRFDVFRMVTSGEASAHSGIVFGRHELFLVRSR